MVLITNLPSALLDDKGTLQMWLIMSVEQSHSDQMILLTPTISYGPLDMAGIDAPVPAG